MAAPRTHRGLDRLVNFSDATVAIAITLLILPLVDIAHEVARQSLGDVLHDNLGSVIGFVITFVVISRFWVVHHRVFEYVASYSPALIWANSVWLLSIVFFPFAANVLSSTSADPSTCALYIGTMVVTTLASGAIDWILLRDPALTRPETRGDLHLSPAVVSTALLVAALLVAVLVPAINLYALLLLLLSRPIDRIVARRRGYR